MKHVRNCRKNILLKYLKVVANFNWWIFINKGQLYCRIHSVSMESPLEKTVAIFSGIIDKRICEYNFGLFPGDFC